MDRFGEQSGARLGDAANRTQLLGRDHLVQRHCDRAGIQDREKSHHPVRRVLADQQHAISRPHAATGQHQRGARGAVAGLAVTERGLLARLMMGYQGSARAMLGGRGFEQFDQVAMAAGGAHAPASVQVQLGENMLAQPGYMNIDPVVAPVDLFGGERMFACVGGA